LTSEWKKNKVLHQVINQLDIFLLAAHARRQTL
jgi:hypothetical protein